MQEQNCIERMSVMIPDDEDITVVEHMTQLNESQREGRQLSTRINCRQSLVVGT